MNPMDDLTQKAITFIQQMVAGDFSSATLRFDGTLAQALPEARLREIWQGLTGPGQVGVFQNILKSQAVDRENNSLVTVTCQFEKAALDIYLVFNRNNQISGLNFQLAANVSPYNPPEYVHPADFQEIEVTVGSGEWALPGTLSLPEGAGPFPAVVLVHGSGPQDRDETLGPNKPFRDLAWGLASRGIAVLRYEKRTKAHAIKFTPELLDKTTTQNEVIDDALAAILQLRQRPGIDPHRIYVLGHSLGATVAPRIGQQDPTIAGLIIMGGLTRPLEDTILDQIAYLTNLSGNVTDAQKADLEHLRVKVARVKDPNLSDQVPADDLPLGIRPAYWLDLRGYHPEVVARTLGMRIFILQGGRDYQVTVAGDFPAWQKALADKRNATLKLYPKLFHLFIAGEGPSTPQEYMTEGHVSEEVIEDIALWMREYNPEEGEHAS
jgi:uncharacterized protein